MKRGIWVGIAVGLVATLVAATGPAAAKPKAIKTTVTLNGLPAFSGSIQSSTACRANRTVQLLDYRTFILKATTKTAADGSFNVPSDYLGLAFAKVLKKTIKTRRGVRKICQGNATTQQIGGSDLTVQVSGVTPIGGVPANGHVFTIVVNNLGGQTPTAPFVRARSTAPFIAPSAPAGCAPNAVDVICPLGAIAPGATQTYSLSFGPCAAPGQSFDATVAAQNDSVTKNNLTNAFAAC